MGVPCARCGRQYDSTLFAFGRTIQCTCGARVADAPRVRSAEPGELRRFFADAMLGRLASWLRMLGFDTAYEEHIADAELVQRSLSEGRTILTRDRRLPDEWTVSDLLLLESDVPEEQLRVVVERFGLRDYVRPFSRCSRCNEPLTPCSTASVGDRVPARVRAEQRELRECTSCGRVYWKGSHTDRMERFLGRALGS